MGSADEGGISLLGADAGEGATGPDRARAPIDSIAIRPGTLSITLDTPALADALGVARDQLAADMLAITTCFTLRRCGAETRIIADRMAPQPDPTLIRALTRAQHWLGQIRPGTSIADIARAENLSDAFIRNRLQPAFLAPAIQQAILDGTQPPDRTLERIIRSNLPLDWQEQRQAFGFTERQ